MLLFTTKTAALLKNEGREVIIAYESFEHR